MDLVKPILAAMLAIAQPAYAQSTADDPYAAAISEAARRFAIPEQWIRAVMQAESAGDPGATSHAGAMGLMQIMPGTYRMLRARYRLGPDPYAAKDNIMAGAAYLREMYDRYGSPGFLAAYNAGPGRLDEHLQDGRPLPAETRRYLAIVTPRLGLAPSLAASPLTPEATPDSLFAVRRNDNSMQGTAANDTGEDRLFAIRHPSRNSASRELTDVQTD